jgi:hypothetical protein
MRARRPLLDGHSDGRRRRRSRRRPSNTARISSGRTIGHRTVFVTERGDELWLAPFATSHWMQQGMKVAVRNAPTRFGKVSYTITSAIAEGRIDASSELPPGTRAPKVILRLRHPEGKPIRSVTVQGKPHTDFDPRREIIILDPVNEAIAVRADY